MASWRVRPTRAPFLYRKTARNSPVAARQRPPQATMPGAGYCAPDRAVPCGHGKTASPQDGLAPSANPPAHIACAYVPVTADTLFGLRGRRRFRVRRGRRHGQGRQCALARLRPCPARRGGKGCALPCRPQWGRPDCPHRAGASGWGRNSVGGRCFPLARPQRPA